MVPTRSHKSMTTAQFASRRELSMMLLTSVASSPFTNESQFQITCLEQDATNTESTISLIMGASAADPCDGEPPVSTDAPMPPKCRQSKTRLQSPSSQHNLTRLDSARYHAHTVSRANKLTHLHARVSTAEQTAASSSDVPLGAFAFFHFAKPHRSDLTSIKPSSTEPSAHFSHQLN
jgi:hypothetical protein